MEAGGDVVPHYFSQMPSDGSAMAQCIITNAERTSRLGQYIGMFEWSLFSFFYSVDVVMHFGREAWNVLERYVPGLATAHRRRVPREADACHVLWCKLSPEGGLVMPAPAPGAELGIDPELRHFVALLPLHMAPAACDSDPSDVHVAAALRGFCVIETAADGNCGLDCMALYLSRERTAAS